MPIIFIMVIFNLKLLIMKITVTLGHKTNMTFMLNNLLFLSLYTKKNSLLIFA